MIGFEHRTTPDNRTSLRRGCGKYGGRGRSITRRFDRSRASRAASRGPRAAGSDIAAGRGAPVFPGADKLTAAIRRPPRRRLCLGRCALASVAAGPWHSCRSPGRCNAGQQGQPLAQREHEQGQGCQQQGAGLILRAWPFWAHGANPMGVRSPHLQPRHHGGIVWPGLLQPDRRRHYRRLDICDRRRLGRFAPSPD